MASKKMPGDSGSKGDMKDFLSNLKSVDKNKRDKKLAKSASRTMLFGKDNGSFFSPIRIVAIIILIVTAVFAWHSYRITAKNPSDKKTTKTYKQYFSEYKKLFKRKDYKAARAALSEGRKLTSTANKRGENIFLQGKMLYYETKEINLSKTPSTTVIQQQNTRIWELMKSASSDEYNYNTLEIHYYMLELLTSKPLPNAVKVSDLTNCVKKIASLLSENSENKETITKDYFDIVYKIAFRNHFILKMNPTEDTLVRDRHVQTARQIAEKTLQMIINTNISSIPDTSKVEILDMEQYQKNARAYLKRLKKR